MFVLKQNLKEEIYSNRMMSNVIQSSFKYLGYTPEDIKTLHKHIVDNMDVGILAKPVNKRSFTDSSIETVLDTIVSLIEDMRKSRQQMQSRGTRRLRDLAAAATEKYAREVLKSAFQQQGFNVNCKIGLYKNKKVGVTFDERRRSGHVILPITWHKKIWKKNISIVRNSRTFLFVIDVKPMKLSRLNANNISAYKAKFIKLDRNKHLYRDDGWLMVHETDSKPVTAAYDDFAKCERLLHKRIKDRSLDVLAAL